MTGNEKLVERIMTASGLLNIILYLILIPNYGTIGAAISTTVCLSFMNIMNTIFVWKKFSFWMVPNISSTINKKLPKEA